MPTRLRLQCALYIQRLCIISERKNYIRIYDRPVMASIKELVNTITENSDQTSGSVELEKNRQVKPVRNRDGWWKHTESK